MAIRCEKIIIKISGSGRVRALNLTVPLGSGRVGSDDLGYGPGSGFSLKPVQTSSQHVRKFCEIISYVKLNATILHNILKGFTQMYLPSFMSEVYFVLLI